MTGRSKLVMFAGPSRTIILQKSPNQQTIFLLDMCDRSDSCHQLLFDELDFLKAMYTGEELEVHEPAEPQESGQVTQLVLHQDAQGIQYEVVMQLSSEYPIIMKPAVFVRSSSINCNSLNRELRYFIEQENLGLPLMLTIIQWISDNIKRFEELSLANPEDSAEASPNTDTKYARFWIYSHHIRSNVKRRKIEDTATAYHLRGFFCPGKPGIIVVEGYKKDCDEFWYEIRGLSWQRIVLRQSEEHNDPSFFRFEKFREILFTHAEFVPELKKMLAEVGLEYGFALLLNL